MKHLKKLSVVLMITTLFSASFTSCIDTEVSPVVEAIYEAQADLIAAQTAVQNAEAALRNAQANAAQAQADYTAAQTAQIEVITAGIEADNAHEAALREQELRLLVAQTDLEVNEAQNALAIAEQEFQIEMAALMAELEEAGVQLAIEYALKYRNAMYAANNILSDKLDAEEDLADAQLMLVDAEDMTYEYHLAQLQNEVAMYEAQVAYITDWLALLNEDAADPLAVMETLRVQIADLEAQEDAMDILAQEQWNKVMAIYDQADNRDNALSRIIDSIDEHNDAVEEKNDREDWIEDAEDDIEAWELALADFAAAKAAAEAVVTAAEAAVTAAEAALGMEDGAGNPVVFDDYYTVDADGNAIAAGGTKYAAPANFQEELVNAHIDFLDAAAAHAQYAIDLDGITLSYNNAATALAAAQAAYDAADYQGDLDTANDDLDDQEADFVVDYDAYVDAKTAFEADPTGSATTDGDGNHSAGYYPAFNSTFDLGEVGIHTDAAPDTYMRVATWKETTLGSGNYIPATLYPTKYNTADLAVEVAALIADAGNGIGANTDVWLWEDDAAPSAMPINDFDGNPAVLTPAEGIGTNTDLHALGATDAIAADGENIAIFINVESDDTSITHLYAFNVATNVVGKDDFSTRPFFTSGSGTVADPYVWNSVLTVGDADAGYDTTPDANGEPNSPADALTAYAEVWNAKLEVAKKENALALGDDLLLVAQNEFDYQKELFEQGVANLAALETAMNDASDAKDDAEEAVDNAWIALGPEIVGTPAAFDPADTLNEELYNAELALADLLACDEACLQANIDAAQANIAQWNAEIANIQPIIDAKYAVITGLFPTLDSLGVEYTFEVDADGLGTIVVTNFGELSSLYSDLHAAIIAEWQVYWDLELQDEMLEDQQDYLEDLLDEYEDQYESLFDDIADFEADLALAQDNLEEAKAALALATNDKNAAEAYITYLEAKIANLEVRYANALAIAAQYKALMDAALAS